MKKYLLFFIKTVFFSLMFFFFFIICITIYIYKQEINLKAKVYPNVYIDNINFGGKTIQDIEYYFQGKNKSLNLVNIFFIYNNKEFATFSGSLINLKYDEQTPAKHAFSIGRTSPISARMYQKIKTILNLGRYDFPANLNYESRHIDEFLGILEEKYNKPAENALFTLNNSRVTAFKIEKYGLQIDKERTSNDLANKVQDLIINYKDDIIIKVHDKVIKPEISLSLVNDFGIVEKIGEGKSDYTGSIPERIHNIILASSKFHGILIPKNEVFSFNKTIGDISSLTGYKPAYIIKNGRTVLGDGGGVCQVSTTLFRAALNVGLPIIERVAHAYRVHYYENDGKPGLDATVFNPSADLKFKNDTSAYILVQTEIDKDNNILTFYLFGKKDERIVQISDVKVWDIASPPESLYQDDPTLKKGITKQVDWSSWGAKAIFHYKVEKGGKITADQDFFSLYRPWRAVFLVGTAD
jgi:vancomycin resistance protein YoaR